MKVSCFIPDIEYQKIIPEFNKRWSEKYVFIMHSILYQQIRGKQSFSDYANLDSRLMIKYIGTSYYKAVLNQLTNSGIIQPYIENGKVHYSRKESKSKAYRINPLIIDNTRIKAVTIKKQTYARKITNVRIQTVKEAIKLNQNIKHEFLMLTYRKIKVQEATNYVKTNYEENTPQYKNRMWAIKEFNEMHKASFERGKENIDFHFSYNKGRVYSPASMLPRDLEQFTYFIGYENERSISLDLPNSQLCFFDQLLKSANFFEKQASNVIQISDSERLKEEKSEHIGSSECKEIGNRSKRPRNDKNNPLPNHYSLCVRNCNQQNTWQSYIYKGLGYEIMMKLALWNNKDSNHTKQERQEFKEIFFGGLFYNAYFENSLTHLEKTFLANFPDEANALREAKKIVGNKRKTNQKADGTTSIQIGGSNLAVYVQKLEGKFFHDICVNYMKTNYKDIPFTIKHDSITLPESCASFLTSELNILIHDFFNTNELNFKCEEL
ncbi:MAG: hypothetical protein RLZZ13_454 [Pseudomonadota bacterium]